MRVVIADDSALIRRHLTALLSSLDHVEVVAEAEDASRALDSVRTLHPEVVVLDIHMPGTGGNGIEALRHIKREFPRTQVIMLTNYSNSFYRAACLNEGADYFLDKSHEFEKVGEVLASIRQGGMA